MMAETVMCPHCGYVAVEGEFFKNGGCPCKGCVGYKNIAYYDVTAVDNKFKLKGGN